MCCCLYNGAAGSGVLWALVDPISAMSRIRIRRESCQGDEEEGSGVPSSFKRKATYHPREALRF